MIRRALPFLAALLLILPAARPDEVLLAGGSRLTGIVLDRSAEEVLLLLASGEEVRLAAADVREVVPDPAGPAPGKYLSFRDGEGLYSAVTVLVRPGGGPRIDLVAAIHIADPAYYRQVQRILEAADVVLYEGVKRAADTPEDFQGDDGEPNPIRDLQQKFAEWFGLAFQLDEIEYSRPHFVHADLTAEELFGEGEPGGAGDGEKEPGASGGGEGVAGTGGGEVRAAPGGSAAAPGRLGDLVRQVETARPWLEAMFSRPGPERAKMKRFMAHMLGNGNVSGILGALLPDLSAVLLDQRNAVVVEKARERLDSGARSMAIFYGGAHMDGIEQALVEDLGYRRAGARWMTAWDLSDPPAPVEAPK